MNDTAAAASNLSGVFAASSYGTLTGIHLALMAVFAILVVIAIVYGVRQKRRRVAAEEAFQEHAAAAGVPTIPAGEGAPSLPADTAEPVNTATMPAPAPGEVTAEPQAPPLADERIAAAAPLAASPAAEAASSPTDLAGPAQGPVTQLKGLGPKVAARLAELGITTVGQIAALTHDDAEALDAQLGAFRGRMGRDRWIEQARFLAAGDRAGFEAVFGKL